MQFRNKETTSFFSLYIWEATLISEKVPPDSALACLGLCQTAFQNLLAAARIPFPGSYAFEARIIIIKELLLNQHVQLIPQLVLTIPLIVWGSDLQEN